MKKLVLLVILGGLLACTPDLCLYPINASIKEKNLIDGKEVYIIKTENKYGLINGINFNKEDRRKALGNINPKITPITIKAEEFSIQFINEYTLKVIMNKNTTDKENVLSIGLQNGDCSDDIEIVQPPSEE